MTGLLSSSAAGYRAMLLGRARCLAGLAVRDSSVLSTPARRLATWAGCAALVLLALRSFLLAQGLRANEVDESVYTYVGWSWAEGYWPYLQSWDHKGPVVYLTTLLRVVLLGLEPEVIGFQHGVVGTMTALLVAAIASRLWAGMGPVVAFTLGVLLWTQRAPQAGVMATPDSLISMFSAGAVLAALGAAEHKSFRGSVVLAALAGLSSGLAVCTKPNAVGGLVVGLVALWWLGGRWTVRRRMVLVSMIAVGVAVPVVVFAIVFSYANALDALVDSYIVFNSIFGRWSLSHAGVSELVQRAAMSAAQAGILRPRLIAALVALTVIAAAPTLVLKAGRQLSLRTHDLIIGVWLLVELGLFISNGAWPYHIFPALPAVALGATWLVITLSRLPYLLGRACSLVAFSLLVIPLMLSTIDSHPPSEHVYRKSADWNRVVERAVQATRPEDKVLILTWDHTFIMNLIRCHSITRYIHTVPLIIPGYTSDGKWVELLDEVEANPPRVILVSVFRQEFPPDVLTALDWAFQFFFRPPYDNTPYPHREQFRTFIARSYRLDTCGEETCLLRHLD